MKRIRPRKARSLRCCCARLLQSVGRGEEALPLLQKTIRQNPDDKRLRLTYARTLVEQDRLDDAKVEFASLLEQYPDDDELRYSWP